MPIAQRLGVWSSRIQTSPIFKNFFIYASGALLLRSVSIIVAPLTLHILSPDDYGLIALIHSFASIVTVLISFGLRQILSLEYFHHVGIQRTLIVNTILGIYLILATPLTLLGLCMSNEINNLIFVGKGTPLLVAITLLYCFIFFFVELMYQLLTYQGKARLVTTVQTSSALCILVINVILLTWFRAGVYSTITSYLIGYSLAAAWGLRRYLASHYPTIIPQLHMHTIRNYLLFGLPFLPSVLCNWLLSSSDRWLLARLASLHDVGIYALADAFGQLYMFIILQPLSNAYLPHLMQQFSANKDNLVPTEQRNRRLTWYGMACAFCCVSCGYLVCKPLALWLLPPKYSAALQHVWLILISYIFLTGTYCFSALIQFQKHTWFLAGALALPAVSNVVLNIVFIPLWGITGCVLATVMAQALYCGITYWYGSRLLRKLAITDKHPLLTFS